MINAIFNVFMVGAMAIMGAFLLMEDSKSMALSMFIFAWGYACLAIYEFTKEKRE